jgi:CBS domain-containing protein
MARLTLAASMTRHPHSIRAGESLRTAEKMLEKLHCHHLPVRDGGRLVGVLTDSDIAFAARIHPDLARVRVEDACTTEPLTVDVDTDLRTAVALMLERRVDSVLVMNAEDGGEPVLDGIFTLRDAARVLHDVLPAVRL